MDLYSFAGGDPINFVDPTGRKYKPGDPTGKDVTFRSEFFDNAADIGIGAANAAQGFMEAVFTPFFQSPGETVKQVHDGITGATETVSEFGSELFGDMIGYDYQGSEDTKAGREKLKQLLTNPTHEDIGAAVFDMGLTFVGGKFVQQGLKPGAAPDTPKKPLAIGENMDDRVIPVAREKGYEFYTGDPNYTQNQKLYGDDIANQMGMEHNRAAIEKAMAEQRDIIDFGPDWERRIQRQEAASAYEMERQMTKEYDGYQQDFISERPSEYNGSMP
jgi:hypothetical protein